MQKKVFFHYVKIEKKCPALNITFIDFGCSIKCETFLLVQYISPTLLANLHRFFLARMIFQFACFNIQYISICTCVSILRGRKGHYIYIFEFSVAAWAKLGLLRSTTEIQPYSNSNIGQIKIQKMSCNYSSSTFIQDKDFLRYA